MKSPKDQLLTNSLIGYALHQIITDKNDIPRDYRFIEINKTFTEMTGIPSDCVGKTILEFAPTIVNDSTDWISFYGEIALTQVPVHLEQYSKYTGKWHTIYASSPKKGYFTTLLVPANLKDTYILNNNTLSQTYYRNESLLRIMAYQAKSIQDFLDYALSEAIVLTSSDIGYIYFFDSEKKEFILNTWSNKVMDACTILEKQTTYRLDDTGFWGEVVRQRKAIINNNFAAPHPLKKGFPKGHAPLSKYMSLPIYDKGEIAAVIGLANKKEDYTNNDIVQIQYFMDNVWASVKRRQAEEDLASKTERLRITLESIGDAVISIDRLGYIQTFNRVAELLTGKTTSEAIGQPINNILFIEEADTGILRKDIADLAMLNSSFSKMNVPVLIKKEGHEPKHISDQNTPILNDQGELQGAVIVIRDIEEEVNSAKKIQYMSYHDPLTGLYNRRFFEEELTRLDTHRQLPISIIMGDVNGLKLTNDVFGHLEGDQLLISAGKLMKKACRTEDIVARWGGDEFVILLPKTNSTRAEVICKMIKDSCLSENNSVIDLSISLGFATKTIADEDINKTLTKAEDFMYRHKLTESSSQRSAIINTMRNSLDERSHETEEHAERLTLYCTLIANALGLSDSEQEDLKLLAMLHDIGKIGIPDHILLKPGSLNEQEWHTMRRHPEIGYRIAQSSNDLQSIAKGILYHHEKWDGTGYPNQIEGENIPLHARILAVADAYDAMISDRPYRNALPKEVAIKELKDNSGTQFDPTIVEIFTQLVSEL